MKLIKCLIVMGWALSCFSTANYLYAEKKPSANVVKITWKKQTYEIKFAETTKRLTSRICKYSSEHLLTCLARQPKLTDIGDLTVDEKLAPAMDIDKPSLRNEDVKLKDIANFKKVDKAEKKADDSDVVYITWKKQTYEITFKKVKIYIIEEEPVYSAKHILKCLACWLPML